MAHTTTNPLTVSRIVRLTNTTSGNPRYKIHFAEGVYWHTAPDSTLGYEIHQGMVGKKYEVSVTGTGRIFDMREVGT